MISWLVTAGPDPAGADAAVLSSAERLAVLRQVGLTAAAMRGWSGSPSWWPVSCPCRSPQHAAPGRLPRTGTGRPARWRPWNKPAPCSASRCPALSSTVTFIPPAVRWQLTWTNAGHPPLLLSHPDDPAERLGDH